MYLNHIMAQAIHDERVETALKRHERTRSFKTQFRPADESAAGRRLARTGTRFAILGFVLTILALVVVPVSAQSDQGTTSKTPSLSFDAAERPNPSMRAFLTAMQQEPEPVASDQDGLTGEQEAEIGSDPENDDTDGDGVSDGGEVNASTDPLDGDGDGFTDKEELDVNTDPLDPDSFPVPSEANSIAITAFTCPAGYEGKELFDDCATPSAGVDFTVSLNASEFGVTQTTNSAGRVAFSDLGPGQYTVHEDLTDVEGALERYTAVCFGDAPAGAPEPRQVVYTDLGGGNYGIELTEGEEITCTWFNIPAKAGTEPTATAPATKTPVAENPIKPGKGEPVTALPNTGTGTSVSDDETVKVYLLAAASLLLLATYLGSPARREP